MQDKQNLQTTGMEEAEVQEGISEILEDINSDEFTENETVTENVTEEVSAELKNDFFPRVEHERERYNEPMDDFEERAPRGNREIPRWNPNPEDNGPAPKPPKKKKGKYVAAIIAGVVILAAAIFAGVFFGVRYMHKLEVKKAETKIQTEQNENSAKISTTTSQAGQNTYTKEPGYILTDVSGVVEDVLPSVVSITSRSLVDTYPDYFSFFFGNRNSSSSSGEKKEIESGLGSGTIISQNDKELLILTSYHVVDNCSSLYVTFMDDNSVDGYVKSADEGKDIAIVAVPLSDISEDTMNYIRIATLSMDSARVGEGVIVIGNALGYGMSVTTGVVSATNRELTVAGKTLDVLQTDAAINEGNSGGCVLNAKGEVIGISEAKIIVTSVEGMCYAIPIFDNADLIETLLNTESKQEKPIPTQGAYLGIQGRDLDHNNAEKYEMPEGIYVAGAIRGGGADLAGITKGDIIVAIDDTETTTMDALKSVLAKHNPGDVVTVTIMREGFSGYEEIQLDVTLTEVLS
ncbi:MAG: trypsin-like peptidase domain-containing protein [Lachnospiraceae bacterium]|nr:trypsin-like peptidase domain-containing protein [Lachnospiraceae bacterium]